MLSKSLCPGQDIPADIDDCIYRCFEAHRRRVLQRRMARKNKQPSYHTTQGSTQHQTFDRPIHVAPPIQTFQQRTSIDIQQPTYNHYQTQQVPTPEPYHQLKEYEYTTPSSTNIIEQQHIPTPEPYHQLKEYEYTAPSSTNIIERQTPAQFQTNYNQRAEKIDYVQENNQYQPPVSQVYDSHITHQRSAGSSIPTGTIEYTKQAYYAQEPLAIQPNITTSYEKTEREIQAFDNRQYRHEPLPQESAQTYNQQTYTNERIVPEQPPVSTYEAHRYNIPESLPTPSVAREIRQEQYIAPTQPRQSFTPTRPRPPSILSSRGSENDSIEDEEIFDLRACICRCYGKFKDAWNKDQQERYQEQFDDIQQPIPPSIPPYSEQPIIPSIPRYLERPIPPCPPCPPYLERPILP
jgi:hypothetical protein